MDEQDRERLNAIEERLAKGDRRMGAIEDGMGAIEGELARNTEVTTEVRDILDVAKKGLKVLGALEPIAKWAGSLAMAATAIWVFIDSIKRGGPPHK